MFTGQNLAKDDITRIVAGRDIVGTMSLLSGRAQDVEDLSALGDGSPIS
jgi:hypothetical protein